MKRRLIQTCLALALLLLTVKPSQAAVFFDTDFETCAVGTGDGLINGAGDFPCEGWDDFGKEFINAPRHNKIEITNVAANVFSGSKAVKNTYVATSNPDPQTSCAIDNPGLWQTFTTQDTLYFRAVVKESAGFQTGVNSTKMFRFMTNSSSGYPVISIGIYGNNHWLLGSEGSYSAGTFIIPTGPTVSQTSWDQVEGEFRMNTPGQSDGVMRMWVNGILYAERLNIQLRGPTPTSVGVGGQVVPSTAKWNTAHMFVQCGRGNTYIDRIAVGNTRIGTVGGSTDITAPGPIVNFKVN